MVVEVAWGGLLIEFMGCSVVKARMIYDGMTREAGRVSDEVFDTLERCCRWDNRTAIEAAIGIYEIREGIFPNMKTFSNMCT